MLNILKVISGAVNGVTQYANGGGVSEGSEPNELLSIFNELKKGDVIRINFDSGITKGSQADLKVVSKNMVGKGKSWQSEKITFININNPSGVRYFAFKRANNHVGFAWGDMAIWNVKVKKEFQNGGEVGDENDKTMREKIAEMNIALNTKNGQVYVGGIKTKNRLFKDEKGYYVVEEYGKFMGKKYPLKKRFSMSENEVLDAYMQDKYASGGGVGIYNKFDNTILQRWRNYGGSTISVLKELQYLKKMGKAYYGNELVVYDDLVNSLSENDKKILSEIEKHWNWKLAKGGGVGSLEETPQEELDMLVQDFNQSEYEAFCYENDIDEEDANEMSDFIYSQTDNEARHLINQIKEGYYSGSFGNYAKGGGISDRYNAFVGDEKITIVKNRKEVIGYPVYARVSGHAAQTIGVFPTKEKADAKARELNNANKMAEGGGVKHFVGKFTESQLKKGEDKIAIEKAQKETGLKYIESKIIKKNGKPYLMEVYLTNMFSEGGGVAKGWTDDEKSDLEAQFAKGGGVGDSFLHLYKLTYPDGFYIVESYDGEYMSPKEAMEKMKIRPRYFKSYKYRGVSSQNPKYKEWYNKKDIGYSNTEAWDEVFENEEYAKGGEVNKYTDYYLVVNLDERGLYSADVRNPLDEVVFSIDSAEEMEELIVDGFLKYKADEDLNRLTKYLMNQGIIPNGSQIYSEDEFESDVRQNYENDNDLLEFVIPTWALPSLINADDSGLNEDDIEKLDKFVKKVVKDYGNANFMLGSESDESYFSHRNDIDSLGSDVTKLYLKPTKEYEKGGGLSGFLNKAKDLGKKGIHKAKEGYKSAKKYTDEKIHQKRKDIALDVVYDTKERLAKGKEESIALEKAFHIIEEKYAKGGEIDISNYENIDSITDIYKMNGKWYVFGKRYNTETSGTGYTKKEALADLELNLSYVSPKDEYAKGGGVGNLEKEIDALYSKSKFINTDFNWRLKLLEMLQDQSVEAYNIYQKLTKKQKDDVLQELFEVDNDMGSEGDGEIETSKENLQILLEDAKNGKKYAKGGGVPNITKVVAFPEHTDFKYYVIGETDDKYIVVNEEKVEHWKNANVTDRYQYFEEELPKGDVIVVGEQKGIFAKGGSVNESVELKNTTNEYGEKYEVYVNGILQGLISESDGKYFVMSASTKGGKAYNSKFFDSIEKCKKYVFSKCKNIYPLGSVKNLMGYAQGGIVNEIKVGSKIGFLRPRSGRYEWAEVLSIDGENINLVVRHPKRSQWDNYFTESKSRIEKFINTESKDWKGRPELKIKFEQGGSISDDTPKVWVGEWSLYNEGKLMGQWIDLSDFDSGAEVMYKISELMNDLTEKTGELREEYAIFDYENFPRSMYSEQMGEKEFDNVIEAYKISQERDMPIDVIGDIMREYSPDDIESFIDENYEGYFESEEDLAYHVIDATGGIENMSKDTLERYFDYESFGRDLSINDYTEFDGHYFRIYKRGGQLKSDYKKHIKKHEEGGQVITESGLYAGKIDFMRGGEINKHLSDFRADFTIEWNVKKIGGNLSEKQWRQEYQTGAFTNKYALECFDELKKIIKSQKWSIDDWSFAGRSNGWFVLVCSGNAEDVTDNQMAKMNVIVRKYMKNYANAIEKFYK